MNEVVKVDYMLESSLTQNDVDTQANTKQTKNSKKNNKKANNNAKANIAPIIPADKIIVKVPDFTAAAASKKRFSMQNSIEDFSLVEQFIPFAIHVPESLRTRRVSVARNNAFHEKLEKSSMIRTTVDDRSGKSDKTDKDRSSRKEYSSLPSYDKSALEKNLLPSAIVIAHALSSLEGLEKTIPLW